MYDPEVELWRAVVFRAVLDTCLASKRTSEVLAKYEAENWLSLENKNFLKICEQASLNPVKILNLTSFLKEHPKFKIKLQKLFFPRH